MNDLTSLEIGRTNLDHLHPARLSKRNVALRPPPRVLMHGGHRPLWRPDDQVRRSEPVALTFPFVGRDERNRCRQVFRVALRRALIDPVHDRVDLLIAERHVVLEFLDADASVDMPRRHLTRGHAVFHRPRPRARVFKRDQRHRRDRIRLMALLTLRLKNRRDVLGKGHRSGRVGRQRRRSERKTDPEHRKSSQPEWRASPHIISSSKMSAEEYTKNVVTIDLSEHSYSILLHGAGQLPAA